MTSSSPGSSSSLRARTFCLAFVLLLNQHTGCAGEGFQRFLVTPESLVAREGEDVTLRCVVQNQRGKVQWTKDGFALGFHRDVPGYPRYTYLGDPARGQHHLSITSVAPSDAGEYQCQVGPTVSNPPIWAAANLSVVLPPRGISLVGQSDGSAVEVVAGASLTLRCRVADARPPPTLLWYLDEKQLPKDQVDSQVVRSVVPHRWSVRSKVTLQPRTQDDGARVICRVLHPGLEGGGALATSVTLSVLHPPGPPSIRGLAEGDTLRAGERRNLTCTCPGGNPRPSLIWYRAGRLFDDSYTSVVQEQGVLTVNTLDLLATEADDGVVLECRAASDLLHLPLTANISLSVYYGPTAVRVSGPARAEEGQSVALRCETSPSSPPSSITWRVNGEEVSSANAVVKQAPSGGWVTSSRLVWQVEGPWQGQAPRQLSVECGASHQSLRQAPHHTLLITLVKPAGAPVLGGEVLQPVVAGSSVAVTCASPNSLPQTSIRIYHGGRIVASRLEHTPAITQARGRVRVNPPDNDSEIKCEVVSPASTKPKVTSTWLSVLFPPRELMGSLEPEVAQEGSQVTLTCLTSSSNPPANLTWTSQGSPPPMATTTTAPAAFGGTSTRSEVVMVVQALDHERRLSCEADNGFGSSLHKSFVLNVLHAPVWREKPLQQVDVWEGEDVSITASASANPGPVRYWWRRGEETLVGAGGALRLGSAVRSMAGNYSISAYSQRGAINTSFFLNVQYAPDRVMAPDKVMVDEGEAVDIRCSASGNPLPSLTWMAGNQSVGSGVGVARLVLRSAQRKDTGLYTCQASGSLPSPPQPVPTKLIVTQPVTIAEEGNTVKGSWASLGGRGRLVCQVRAAPSPTFLWTTDEGEKIYNSNKYLIHQPTEVDGLVTWSSVLEVSNVSLQDYRPYHCSATNPLGSGSTALTLQPPSRPLPPTNLTVISVSNVSVVLGWTPNLEGSRPVGYTVRYRPTGTRYYQYEEVPDGSSTSTEVGGLTPDVEYSLTAQAKNNQGHSDYVTPPVIITTLAGGGEVGGGEDASQVTSFLLLAIIMAVFGLLVLNAIAIACFVHHRTKKRAALRGVHPAKASSANALSSITANADHRHHHHLHHPHNQVLLALDSLSCQRSKKSKGRLRPGRNRLANVIPLPSPSAHRNKIAHVGKFSKHTKGPQKSSSAFMHNGKIPRPPPFHQHNNKSGSHPLQVLAPENSKTSKQRKQTTPSPSVPEACSLLVAHNQEKIIASRSRHANNDQVQLSDSSRESTQTAIFCEDNIPEPPPRTAPEKPLHLPEHQRAQVSLHQLNSEVKQYFQSREAAQQRNTEEESSKSLEYINLDNCTGDTIEPESASGQAQEYNYHQASPAQVDEELFTSDDTTTSSEYQVIRNTRPAPPIPFSHVQEGLQTSTHMMQESRIPHQQQDIQHAPGPPPPPKNTNTIPSPAALDYWPPATSPGHMQQHRVHSASPTRARMIHQPPEPPIKPRQVRAVSYSPTIPQQGDGAPGSPPSVRHQRTASELPVRVTHHTRQDSPGRTSQHMSRASPVRVVHHVSPESPEIIRRQYRAPSESPVRTVHHISTESPSSARSVMRRNSESPHRLAEHEGILKSPSREMSNLVPSQSAARSRQQPGESPTRVIQRHSESPVQYREYHKAPPESPAGGHGHHPPLTPTRSHQNQVTSTPRSYKAHSSPDSQVGHQSNPPHQGLPHTPQRQQQNQSPGHVVISRRAQTPSPVSHKNPRPSPLSPKSSVPDLTSPELHFSTPQAAFSLGQLNSLQLTSLPPSNAGRYNLPPTPPRPKKPRQLPSFPPSHPTLVQPLPRPPTNTAARQLSPEEISTSFVVPEAPQMQDKEQALSHLPPPRSVSEAKSHESKKRFRDIVKASGSPSTVRRQVAIQTDNYQVEQSTQSVSSMATQFASVNSPIATSSPLTHRRRARFPDDFLWQGASGKM
ncbi:nephrin-like [Eriocheir sinensis]|uniref:nephrin-like n=1 Tax=Eriocheir sinensis TaxID=95602 RepID=UPI0021C7E809|nr:nephrin-like [Eriocheir sinensis]